MQEAVGSPHEFLERTTRLVQLLSGSIPALHSSHAQPTMNFCAAAIRWLFKFKLESVLEKRDVENAARWEDAIFRGLMQPILVSIIRVTFEHSSETPPGHR